MCQQETYIINFLFLLHNYLFIFYLFIYLLASKRPFIFKDFSFRLSLFKVGSYCTQEKSSNVIKVNNLHAKLAVKYTAVLLLLFEVSI